jgi:hypothetical protein
LAREFSPRLHVSSSRAERSYLSSPAGAARYFFCPEFLRELALGICAEAPRLIAVPEIQRMQTSVSRCEMGKPQKARHAVVLLSVGLVSLDMGISGMKVSLHGYR